MIYIKFSGKGYCPILFMPRLVVLSYIHDVFFCEFCSATILARHFLITSPVIDVVFNIAPFKVLDIIIGFDFILVINLIQVQRIRYKRCSNQPMYSVRSCITMHRKVYCIVSIRVIGWLPYISTSN